MFSLLYGFWQKVFERVEYRVLILGIDQVGKTTLLERIKVNYKLSASFRPSAILPTVGLNIARVEDPACRLVFWDLGGASGLRSIWDEYYREADSVLFVVDCSEKDRLAESMEVLEECLSSNDLVGVPVLVFANKQDLVSTTPDASTTETIGAEILDRGIFETHGNHHVLGGSAYEDYGVKEGVQWLINVMKTNQIKV